MKAAIIGAGRIGSALGQVFRASGHEVELWDRDTARTPERKPLADILPSSDAVIFCTPSWATRSAVADCIPLLSKGAVVASLAKGLEKDAGKTMDEVLAELLPGGHRPYALLGGPMLAKELALGLPGVVVAATRSRRAFERVCALFRGSKVRCEWTKDVRAAAYLGVLKNIFAIGLGIADGLEWGLNAKGWFAAAAIREMDGIVRLLAKDAHSAAGTAGAGDFIATAFSPYSKNREFGHRIVKTGQCDLTSEGCVSLPALVGLLGKKTGSFPILSAVNRILTARSDAKTVFEQLLKKA